MNPFLKILILFLVIFVAFGFVFAVDIIQAQAETTTETDPGGGDEPASTADEPGDDDDDDDGDSGTVSLDNPISYDTPQELIGGIISYVMGLVGILAVAALIYGGILYLTSAGSEERVKQAKNVITYAIIGLVIAILSYVIVNAVISAIGGSGS